MQSLYFFFLPNKRIGITAEKSATFREMASLRNAAFFGTVLSENFIFFISRSTSTSFFPVVGLHLEKAGKTYYDLHIST